MANPLKDTFDFVRDCYAEWFRALRQPWSAAARLLSGPDATSRVGRATGFWFSAFFLSIVVSLPIYSIYGLKLENLSFQLCAILAQYLTLLGFSAAFHYSLRRYRINSDFAETFVLYTVVSAALGPVITVMALPAILRSLRLTSEIKAKHLTFVGTVKETVLAVLHVDNSVASILVMAIEPFMAVLGMFVLSTFVQLLAE